MPGLRPVFGTTTEINISAGGAATNVSGPIANTGVAAHVVLLVHVSATSGTPTLNASLEESNDNVTYTAVAGSSIAQLTAAGNAVANAIVTKPYVRITSAVAGTTPSVTYKASALVLAT